MVPHNAGCLNGLTARHGLGVDACRHLPRPYRHLALVVVKDFREDKLAFKPQTLQGIVALQVAWVGKDHVKHHKCRTVLGKQGGA